MEQHDAPDLAAFLAARLAEAELFAHEAAQRDWYATDNYVECRDGGEVARFNLKADARLAARHDPARVLAEVEAKRRIVELHGHRPEQTWEGATITGDCRECIDEHYPCLTLRLLALPEAGHPDYREEWKP